MKVLVFTFLKLIQLSGKNFESTGESKWASDDWPYSFSSTISSMSVFDFRKTALLYRREKQLFQNHCPRVRFCSLVILCFSVRKSEERGNRYQHGYKGKILDGFHMKLGPEKVDCPLDAIRYFVDFGPHNAAFDTYHRLRRCILDHYGGGTLVWLG